MADEDKEKAEKLAAAKKRFEQLKKEKEKKGKKGAGKKKEDKTTTAETKPEDATAESTPAEEPSQSAAAVEDETSAAVDETVAQNGEDHDEPEPEPERQSSLPLQSKQRSESFRQGAGSVLSPVSTNIKAGSGPMSPGLEVQELYKKQATRIEELEKENSAFKEHQHESATRLAKAEEELESLREGSSDVAELKSKAKETDRLSSELASVQRQLGQAQQAAKTNNRRVSGASPEVSQELASKTSTIESLELELSNLRNQLNGVQSTLSERDASIKDIEEKSKAAEAATESYKQELDQLKVSMAFPSDETKAANEDPEALTKRITILESDLRTANTNLDAAQQRVNSLEQKIEALTKLHREAMTTTQSKERELTDLRSLLKRRDRPSHVRDASDFELGEEETETGGLQAKIRALEAENFDLRRGVWREKRAELQPGMNQEDFGAGGPSPDYEDVDLNGPYTPRFGSRQGSLPRQSSTFQDVITSGISAFTGRSREQPAKTQQVASEHARKQSLGLLDDDDDGFDEEAWQQAQEEEAKRRVERVKEVKRGLDQWRGWRVDLADLRQQGLGGPRDAGPVFEV